jgi:electron transfer flavoprotein alpha subunit
VPGKSAELLIVIRREDRVGPVLVLVARDDAGGILRSSLALVTLAKRLGAPAAVVCGEVDVDAVPVGVLGRYGATRIIAVGGDAAEQAADVLVEVSALVELARREDPAAILLSSTAHGREVAARVAVRLDSGVLADAVDVVPGPGGPVAIQEAFTGSCMVGSAARRGIPVITVRVDAAVPEPAAVREPVHVESVAVDAGEARCSGDRARVLRRVPKPAAARKPDLAAAAVVVAGGRGVGSADGFELLGRVADALGGAVGGSHAAADQGWCPQDAQIDQTGATVSPRLYLACGISGSVRHRAGMQDSRTIVAIDKDPTAPIFRIADFGVVGDLQRVLPALLGEIAQRRARNPHAATATSTATATDTNTTTAPSPTSSPTTDVAAGVPAAHPGTTLDHAEA